MSPEKTLPLQGLNCVSFESRLSDTMGGLIRLQGGDVFLAPSMKEVPIENNPRALAFGEKLFKGEADVLIFLTGVGAKALLEILSTRYEKEAVLEAFRKTTIVPRGPKPIRVLREWNVPFAMTVPEPNTWKELIETLDQNSAQVPLQGKKVFVQEYGVSNPDLLRELQKRGAVVSEVPVYRWALPDDLGPVRSAIQQILDGRIDISLFTTAVQIHHLLQVAGQMGKEREFLAALNRTAVASVGPDCTEALRLAGVGVDIEPQSPKMGPLVLETAYKARSVLAQKRKTPGCGAEVLASTLDFFQAQDVLRESLFLKACRLEKTDRVPVWLMRQAGRYMKDYRDVREKTPFLDLCKNKELAAEVTVTAQEKIKADAAIIFSDILLILEPMGLGLTYQKGDGPMISNPVRDPKDFEGLRPSDPRQSLKFVLDAIRLTRRSLKPNIPLIGFAGAPFTMASYAVQGGGSKDFSIAREMMRTQEGLWRDLLTKIAVETADYLNAQIEAGCQALQIFDSWAGLLTPEEYGRYAMPYTKLLVSKVKKEVPLIHFGTKTAPFIEKISEAGGDVIGVDQGIRLPEAFRRLGPQKAVQGNMDPKILLGKPEDIKKEAVRILNEAGNRPGFIFNLGHGVLPETPVENVIFLVETVHEFKIA